MIRKLALALALFVLAAFGFAACGDDEDDGGDEPAATTEPAEPAGGGAGGASAVEIVADPSGSLAFETESAEAKAGTVELTLVNDSSVPHDVRVESDGEDLGGTDTISGSTTTAEVELEAGDYTFYCSVGGHRESGMEGALTVE